MDVGGIPKLLIFALFIFLGGSMAFQNLTIGLGLAVIFVVFKVVMATYQVFRGGVAL